MYLRESCVETLEEALNAQRKGADRIEYCSELEHDGLTPSYKDVREAIRVLDIPIMVMIRPRKGNFEYSAAELEEMKNQIVEFKKMGVAGVVFGILLGQCIDAERTRQLAELAYPLQVCFHKAIDEVEDLAEASATLAQIPQITRVLTSGGEKTAAEGAEMILKMMASAGASLSIMPAGRVRPSNLAELHEKVGATEYHGRGIV